MRLSVLTLSFCFIPCALLENVWLSWSDFQLNSWLRIFPHLDVVAYLLSGRPPWYSICLDRFSWYHWLFPRLLFLLLTYWGAARPSPNKIKTTDPHHTCRVYTSFFSNRVLVWVLPTTQCQRFSHLHKSNANFTVPYGPITKTSFHFIAS